MLSTSNTPIPNNTTSSNKNLEHMSQGYLKISQAISNLVSACPSAQDSSYREKWEEIKSEMSSQLLLVQSNVKNSDNIIQSFKHLTSQIDCLEGLVSSKDLDSQAIEIEIKKITEIYSRVEKSFQQLTQLSDDIFSNCHKKFKNLLQDIGTVEINEMVKELEENKKEQKEMIIKKEENEINFIVTENEEKNFENSLSQISSEKDKLKLDKVKLNQELINLQAKKKGEKENYEKSKSDMMSNMRQGFSKSRENTRKMIIDRCNKKISDVKGEHERLRIKVADLRQKYAANSSLWSRNPYEDQFNEAFRLYCNIDKEVKVVDKILDKELFDFDKDYDMKYNENENKISTEVAKIKLPLTYEQEEKILNNQIEEINKVIENQDKKHSEFQNKIMTSKNNKLRYNLQKENSEKKIQELKNRENIILETFKKQGHNSPITAYVYFQSILDFSGSIQNSIMSVGSLENFTSLIQKVITNSIDQIENILNNYEITNIEKMSIYNKLMSYVFEYSLAAYSKQIEITNIKFKHLMNSTGNARKINLKNLFCEQQQNISNRLSEEELEDLESELETKYSEMTSRLTKEKKNEIIKKNLENIKIILQNLKSNLAI